MAKRMPVRFRISLSQEPREGTDWLKHRGYRCVVAAFPGTPGGVLFQRAADAPVELAVPGDTLVWTGKRVLVEAAL